MTQELTLDELLDPQGPVCLLIKATLEPVGDQDRFQPAGFPEVGHVIYDAPRSNGQTEKVCIVDSAASMANHLESVCMAGSNDTDLHPDLSGLPYVVCVTDREFDQHEAAISIKERTPHDRIVFTSLTEGHRLASEYFLDGLFGNPLWDPKADKDKDYWKGTDFRQELQTAFQIIELKTTEEEPKGDKKKGKKKPKPVYFITPESQWSVYRTIFQYDPNSLVHGVFFAKEQIKISRFLAAGLEAFGAARVGSSGVKFDRLGKTLSGQPIFPVDQETAREVRATFVLDLALLRSYGRGDNGLKDNQKKLLLGLALWKIKRLLSQPFRFRSGCHLKCVCVGVALEGTSTGRSEGRSLPSNIDMQELIRDCQFGGDIQTRVYYPANKLFKLGKPKGKDGDEDSEAGTDELEVDKADMEE